MNSPNVGFNSVRSFLEATLLSVLLAKQQFGRVVLVTDKRGKQLLEGLPFDEVSVLLEETMQGVNPQHWALAKLEAIASIETPLIHLDMDVCLFKPLPDLLLDAPLFFQSVEDDFWEKGYLQARTMTKNGKLASENFAFIDWNRQKAYNCGIIGVNHRHIVTNWLTLAREWCAWFDAQPYTDICTGLFFEQYLIAALADHQGIGVKTLEDCCPHLPRTWDALRDQISVELGYFHSMAEAKRDPRIEAAIHQKLHQLFPAQAACLLL